MSGTSCTPQSHCGYSRVPSQSKRAEIEQNIPTPGGCDAACVHGVACLGGRGHRGADLWGGGSSVRRERDDRQGALAAGRTTAADLVRAYTARIDAYDRTGPRLNAVREMNPDALAIAATVDSRKSGARRPLEGIPVLLKDNIATGDAQHTTAGSLALADAYANRDATVTELLRDAGAVILGKANLTEFANILAIDMPSGYSSLGGQVRNPYVPQLDFKDVPIVQPGGSSSGSAVAVAAGLTAVAIGTETSGSLLSPATQNGVVTVNPTVGLISRAGIIPIAHSQDTAGPLTRTVRDAAILLNVLAA